MRAARRSHRGQARRRLPAGRVADRLGHADQHERQRGDREPREPARGRRARLEGAGASERPREQRPVVQRRVPDGDARRGASRRSKTALLPPSRAARRRSTTKARRVRRRRQDRAHAPDGRDAADARPGDSAAGPRSSRRGARRSQARCRRSTSSRSAARRSAPGSTRTRGSARGRRASSRRSPASRSRSAPTSSPRSPAHDALVARERRAPHARRRAMKIANDVRWLACGPRAGLGEIKIPDNEPGLVDHAGQGQPDAVRGDDDGRARRCSATTRGRRSPARRATSSSTSTSR